MKRSNDRFILLENGCLQRRVNGMVPLRLTILQPIRFASLITLSIIRDIL